MDKDVQNLEDIRHESPQKLIERVKDNLMQLEVIREAKLLSYKFRKKVAIPTAILITPPLAFLDYMLLVWQRGSDDSGAGITVLVLGGLYWWVTQPKRDYAAAYKKDILPKLAKTLGLTYKHKGKISMSELESSKIVPRHDKYETDDYFEGSYKNVGLKFSEINLKQRRRSKKRTYYVSVFKGLAILLEMDRKKFFGHTLIQQNQNSLMEWFKEKGTGLKRAKMVDPEFEKMFDAYTDDQVEARYLLDPAILEKMKHLSLDYEGNKLMAAYYDDKVLVMIATKHNHFEPADLHIPATDPVSIKNMHKEITQILSLIDKLDLYDPHAAHEGQTDDPAEEKRDGFPVTSSLN